MEKLWLRAKSQLLILIIGIVFGVNNSAFGAYEIIKATTVGNTNLKQKEQETDYLPTYNDPELPMFSPEDSIGSKIERKARKFFEKKNKSPDALPDETVSEKANPQNASDEKAPEVKVNDKNKFQINADKITYDDTEGNVEIISKSQGVTLRADNAVLDKANQTIKLRDNVKIIKKDVEMVGEYMLVDLNEENILMDNPSIEAYSFIIKGQEGYLIANDIQMINGTAKSAVKTQYPLITRGFMRLGPFGAENLYDDSVDMSDLNPSKKQVYTIDSKELVLTSYKDHDSILLKGSNISYNNHKFVRNADIEIISDKQNQVIETNAPEAGSMRNFGAYLGYGLMYRLPKGQTLKLMPALVYKSGLGVGLIGRHQSRNSTLEAGWGTPTSDLVVRGKYKLSPGLNLRYGRHAYMSEGFMGARRSGYAAQLEYQKSYQIADLDARFNHGVYAGIFSDYKNNDQSDAYATTRFRYMAELTKTLLSYENKEQDLKISLSAVSQAMATLYGSGQTAALARIGPFITTRLKKWESGLGYFIGGIHGDSPFIFDKYRYGKSSIMLNEKFNFNNKFALGYRATVTPLKDNYEEDLLTESRLYALFGPKDVKMALSYDFVRDTAHVEFMFLLGSDSTRINFDKLTTKNIDGGQEKRDFYKHAKRVKIEENL